MVTTANNKHQRPVPDLVKRQFGATDVDPLWLADMTCVASWPGLLHLAVVTDVYGRLFGWLGIRGRYDG